VLASVFSFDKDERKKEETVTIQKKTYNILRHDITCNIYQQSHLIE